MVVFTRKSCTQTQEISWVFFIVIDPLVEAMPLDPAQVWDLHDYLIDRDFILYDEDEEETYTRWQHEPSGSVVKILNDIEMTEALTIAAAAQSVHLRHPRD
jgi:hypothetical protein